MERNRKAAIRERIWRLLEMRQAARFPGASGRIQNFVGTEAADRRIQELPIWHRVQALKCNPVLQRLRPRQ
ncbi:MAG: hypothetical protein HYZ89_03600 [Candidatus Omnitrophica bacterium]|nr:hypothetical protein [Candidatus Omnitrophota bacterium]